MVRQRRFPVRLERVDDSPGGGFGIVADPGRHLVRHVRRRRRRRLVRAIIDGGGVITVEVARRATNPIAPHHASGSLLRTWRGLHREARYLAADKRVPPWDKPIEALREIGELAGYQMTPDLVERSVRRCGGSVADLSDASPRTG